MKFSQPGSDFHIPDGAASADALARTTHLGIGAHQDDLEFMAPHGILSCYEKPDAWFGGVTCTDGAGSSRTGPYAAHTDEDMKAVRLREQRKAAVVGDYAFMAQLGHPSSNAKDPDARASLVEDLQSLLRASRPQIVYTHNPFDKHATHIGVFRATLAAIRNLPDDERPRQLLGCEVWRGLDWLPDSLKVVLDVGARPNLNATLNGIFDSQIIGGKRYDLAVEGRRLANATFHESHQTDQCEQATYAIDLTRLIQSGDAELSLDDFVEEVLTAFADEIRGKLAG